MVEIKNRWTGDVIKTVDEANLCGADLREANLREANLCEANLCEADLCEADLCEAKNIPPIDVVSEFKGKVLASINAEGCSLDMRSWHACETCHCLAGWATTIHPQGKLLESIVGVKTAGALIFNACCGEIPSFYSSGEQALDWLYEPSRRERVEA